MASRRVLAAVAAGLAGLALAGADGTREEPALAAETPPALVPIGLLGHPATHVRPAAPRQPGPQTCAIGVDRCSAEPCIQFVRDRRRCDTYPDAVPRMVPVR